MPTIERRVLLSGLAAAPLAAPALLRAQSTSRPVQIGLVSDMSGPFKDVGGPGNRVAAELAIQDFGGTVLGRPITIRQADGQNRADISAQLAREWLDNQGVDALCDGAASSAGLAIQEIARERKRIYLITGPATSDMTGSKCSPYGMHVGFDTYALSYSTGTALTKAGGDTWYFITADYAFGHALERDSTAAVRANGGRVVGAVRAPLNTADYSSFLIQARSSGAKVIGMALAGIDMQNCIKQAAEFGLTRGGARIANLLVQAADIVALGQKTCEGMVFTDSFYWDMSEGVARLVPPLHGAHDHPARPAARRRLHRGHALAEGGEGGRLDRGRPGRREDEGHAGERHVQHRCPHPRGRPDAPHDVSLAGQARGRSEAPL